MSTYTISKINADGTVTVSYSVDNKLQNLDNLPISDAVALKDALDAYGLAYEAGIVAAIADNTPTVPAAVTALIGKTETVDSIQGT